MWIGEGWRELAEECHARILEEFPDYELLNVKQKHGALEYQASLGPGSPSALHGRPKNCADFRRSRTRSEIVPSASASGVGKPGAFARNARSS